MLELSKNTISEFERIIIPQIHLAADASLRAYEQGLQSDGNNYFDNYALGCCCWNFLFNRLDHALMGDTFFTKKVFQKVMSITCQNLGAPLTFYVSRVDESLRIPRSGKSIKEMLHNQLFLSDEIQEIVALRSSTIFVLSYDIDIDNGLGSITFEMLYAAGKKKIQNYTVHVFESATAVLPSVEHQPVQIAPPTVTRASLPNAEKSSNE